MTPKFSRISIVLLLISTAFILTQCSNQPPTDARATPSNEIENRMVSQTPNNPPLPAVTQIPTKSEDSALEVSEISKSTNSQTVIDFPTQTITLAQVCPAWVYQKQEYSHAQWNNIPSPRKPEDYFGFQYESLPIPLEYRQASLVDNSDYGIIWVKDEGMELLWLEKIICTYWDRVYNEVLDVLKLPSISQNDMLAFGRNECRLNGVYDAELIVIAEKEITGHLTEIKKVWRANRRTERFEELPSVGIDCVVVISE